MKIEKIPEFQNLRPTFDHQFEIFEFKLCTMLRSLFLTIVLLGAALPAAASSASATGGKSYRLLLFTEECYETWFTDYDVTDVPCLKSIISRGLSIGIIVGSTALKVPQIVNFLKYQSTQGVSSTMLYLDVLSFTPGPIYNTLQGHPFMTYGEQIIVLGENILIVLLMWYLTPRQEFNSGRAVMASLAFAAFAGSLYNAPEYMWYAMPILGAMLAAGGRVPQVLQNYNSKSTGTLSVFTFFLQFAGGAARIFTSLHETGDMSMVAGQAVGMTLSGIVLAQIAMYWDNTKKQLKQNKA